jgi:Asp-tRNA(Asn)/Glu-tRNA(Gln) amidotransferase A subunit family amidase
MSTYRRDPVRAPKLSGTALKAMVAAIESPLGAPVIDQILRDSGFERFRDADPGASPMQCPLPRPAPEPADSAREALCDKALEPVSPPATSSLTTVRALREAYRGGLSPVDVLARVHAAVDRFESVDRLGLFIARHPDEARRDAEESARRISEGAARSALEGIAVVIKDEVDVQGYATTLGTKFLRDVALADATISARLRAAGAVIVGKANMNEIGINPIGLNPHWGAARNPWDRGRITGGSSSASAAAVAAGVAPIAIGADGGGSIRIPAALCGIVGLKATHGRVPETGVPALCWNVGHAGPMGLTVDDVAACYAIIAGDDGHDTASYGQPAPTLDDLARGDLRGLRVGLARPYFEDADRDVVLRCEDALRALTDAGAAVHEVPAPTLNNVLWAHSVIILSEMREAMLRHLRDGAARFGLDSRTNLAIASRFTATDLVHAMRHRHRITRDTLDTLRAVDVLITPSTAITAPPIPERALPDGESNLPVVDALMRFVRVANLTGFPAISVPAGYDAAGLPVGVQLLGRPWEEHTLLRAARVIEAAVPRRVPAHHVAVLDAVTRPV